ncbi:Transposase zinc-ribbon domain protein [Roseovarius gaetbuli]|uniref:Transposase zinc-ribbon domain protein n=1 Tax=Roseovarius gaetbuli TaxID=1356575 RepID=A0A1X7ADQ5_9RHOB|nr:Transposase zinc-ribbon domain protein [Roseovarius gaetbuli]
MSEEEARTAFRQIRWTETEGEPICPECGCVDHYDLKTRQVYKCKGCAKQFSITSGTIFASRKLQVRDILAAIAIFINGAKGYSALQLSRETPCFLPVEIVERPVTEEPGPARAANAASAHSAIEIDIAGGHQLRIVGGYDPEALARLIRGLSA